MDNMDIGISIFIQEIKVDLEKQKGRITSQQCQTVYL